MAVVYTELQNIIDDNSFGGIVDLSNATVALCLSLLMDARFWSGTIEKLTQGQQDQLDQWIAQAFGELQMTQIGFVHSTMTDDNPMPARMLPLDGTTYLRTEYPDLWDVLPVAIKTATDLTLPNANNRIPRQHATGEVQGNDEVTLAVANLPSHQHNYEIRSATVIAAGELAPVAIPSITTELRVTSATGDGTPISVAQASFGVKFWIVAR